MSGVRGWRPLGRKEKKKQKKKNEAARDLLSRTVGLSSGAGLGPAEPSSPVKHNSRAPLTPSMFSPLGTSGGGTAQQPGLELGDSPVPGLGLGLGLGLGHRNRGGRNLRGIFDSFSSSDVFTGRPTSSAESERSVDVGDDANDAAPEVADWVDLAAFRGRVPVGHGAGGGRASPLWASDDRGQPGPGAAGVQGNSPDDDSEEAARAVDRGEPHVLIERDLRYSRGSSPSVWALCEALRRAAVSTGTLFGKASVTTELSLRFCSLNDSAGLLLTGVLVGHPHLRRVDFTGHRFSPLVAQLLGRLLSPKHSGIESVGLVSGPQIGASRRNFGLDDEPAGELPSAALSELLKEQEQEDGTGGVLPLSADMIRPGHVLGQGTFGVVRVCTLANQFGSFAVKIMNLQDGDSGGSSVAAFQDEVAAMKRLRHPNLVRLVGAALSENPLRGMVVMELYDIPFKGFLKRRSDLVAAGQDEWFSDDEMLLMARQAWMALGFLHANNVAHLDIKGENILVRTAGLGASPASLHLGDMGTARDTTGGTLFKTMAGTLAYMSPEIRNPPHRYEGVSSDCYAMGLVTFELASGVSVESGGFVLLASDSDRPRARDDTAQAERFNSILDQACFSELNTAVACDDSTPRPQRVRECSSLLSHIGLDGVLNRRPGLGLFTLRTLLKRSRTELTRIVDGDETDAAEVDTKLRRLERERQLANPEPKLGSLSSDDAFHIICDVVRNSAVSDPLQRLTSAELRRQLLMAASSSGGSDEGRELFEASRTEDDANTRGRMLHRAADLGSVDAQAQLGRAYLDGHGDVTEDHRMALRFLRLAADGGHSDSQYWLGRCFDPEMAKELRSITANAADSLKYLRMAVKQDHPRAVRHLAIYFMNGECGVRQDPNEAAVWFRKGAELGDPMCQVFFLESYCVGYRFKANDSSNSRFIWGFVSEMASVGWNKTTRRRYATSVLRLRRAPKPWRRSQSSTWRAGVGLKLTRMLRSSF
jgi:serine/threonine protein kinase